MSEKNGTLTVTEALAEIKTIGKRLEKKRQFVQQYMVHQNHVKDPLDKQGGSKQVVASELQAIADLEDRVVQLRAGILRANMGTELTLNGTTRSVQDWLTWRRDVSKGQVKFQQKLVQNVAEARRAAAAKELKVVEDGSDAGDHDLIVHVDEKKLFEKAEELEQTLGALDGQLSLLNARMEVQL